MKSNPKSHPIFALFAKPWSPFVFAALMGAALAFAMPLFSGPDERGHLGYIASLSQGHLPLMPRGMQVDLNTGLTYQAQHPPLFYALATPFYLLTGRSAQAGLLLTRFLSVAALLLTVWFSARIARAVLSPVAARRAIWLVAANPILIYICAMANNESLAIAFSTGSVCYALRFARTGSRALWSAAVLCGGLGLLTKMTAVGGIVAAFAVLISASHWRTNQNEVEEITEHKVGKNENQSDAIADQGVRPSFGPAIAFLGAVLLLWAPWAFASYAHYGTMAPRLFQPLFVGGAGALLLYPLDALMAAFQTLGQFALGLVLPMWLMHGGFWEMPLILIGAVFALSLGSWTLMKARWRFVAAAFFGVWVLVLMQAFFRDIDAVVGASRYVGVATPLVALVVSDRLQILPRAALGILRALWLVGIAAVFAYYFQFFR